MAKIVPLDISNEEHLDTTIERCVNSLRSGKVIAIPTDTIYGIAALSQNTEAVNKLYEIKKRDYAKAIAICVGSITEVKKWGKVTISDKALSELLPGPVTLVFERSPDLNPELNPDKTSIGIRIPEHSFVKRLAERCGEPFALTSANISAGMSPLRVDEFTELWDDLDVVVDGGVLGDTEQSRAGSTVVDLSVHGMFSVIRHGCAYQRVVDLLQNTYGLKCRPDL